MSKTEKAYNAARAGKTDGRTFEIEADDIKVGAVFREVQSDGSTPSYGDATVLGVWLVDKMDRRIDGPGAVDKADGVMVKLGRPYCFSSVGGTGLVGLEVLEVRASVLTRADRRIYKAVVQSTGLVATMET